MTTQEEAAALAARIVGYCHANALTLDGIVAELGAGEPLDATRAERLAVYCHANALTLGGLLDGFIFLRVELIYVEQEAQMRECMANRDTYDLARVREVVDYYETEIGYDSNGAKVARAILAERLAELPAATVDYAFATDCDEVRRHEEALNLAMQLRSLLELRADWTKRGKLTLVEKATVCIDALCAQQE